MTVNLMKKKKEKTIMVNFNRIIFSFIGVVIYVVRNVVPWIPFPFHGVYGYDHYRVKELINAIVFVIMFMNFQTYYQKKIKHVLHRV